MPKSSGFLGRMTATQGKELLLTAGPAALLVIAAFFFTLRFVEPGPPKSVAITTGGETGAYYAFGKRYAESLAKSGTRLEVRSSAGSVENLRRLADPASGISIAILQGGIGNSTEAPYLRSVGRIFHEPLWVFYRGPDIDKLDQLAGKRIAVGPDGSGTRALATALLKASRIGPENSALSPLTAKPAADALQSGQLDAVFLALAPQAPLIQELLRAPGVKLMSFAQADAYTKLFPYLAKVALPRGVIDLVADIPARDVSLVAPTAVLVVREDLHPAIVALLAEAAQDIHNKPGIFSKTGEFPSHEDPEFDMDPDALRFYKSGPTFWKRILPFWLANMMERLVVFMVPLLTVMLPLMKAVPWLYRWRIRQRLLTRYRQLKDLEARIAELPPDGDLTPLRVELEQIDMNVRAMPIPIQFSEQFYDLRSHIQMVRDSLRHHAA